MTSVISQVNGDIIRVNNDHSRIDDRSTNVADPNNESYSMDLDEQYPDINQDQSIKIQKPRVYKYVNKDPAISVTDQKYFKNSKQFQKERDFKITWACVSLNRIGYLDNYQKLLQKIYKDTLSKEQLVELCIEILKDTDMEMQDIPEEKTIPVNQIPQKYLFTNSIYSYSNMMNYNTNYVNQIDIPLQSIPSINTQNSEYEIEDEVQPDNNFIQMPIQVSIQNEQLQQNINNNNNNINNTMHVFKQIQTLKDKQKMPTFTCQVCFDDINDWNNYFKMEGCKHDCCKECFTQYLNNLINNSHVLNITCHQEECKQVVTQNVIERIVDANQFKKYKKFKKRLLLKQNPNIRFCIRPDCEHTVIVTQGNLKCVCVCGMQFCGRCSGPWHPLTTCEQTIDKEFQEYMKSNIVQNCPKCFSKTEKKDGCNHITCTVCKHEWCWLCKKKYKPGHYSRNNLIGCPGFYAKIQEWPLKKIYLYRVKKITIFILRILFFLIFGIFILFIFAAQVFPRKLRRYLQKQRFQKEQEFNKIEQQNYEKNEQLRLTNKDIPKYQKKGFQKMNKQLLIKHKILEILLFILCFLTSPLICIYLLIKYLIRKCCRPKLQISRIPGPRIFFQPQQRLVLRNMDIQGDNDVPDIVLSNHNLRTLTDSNHIPVNVPIIQNNNNNNNDNNNNNNSININNNINNNVDQVNIPINNHKPINKLNNNNKVIRNNINILRNQDISDVEIISNLSIKQKENLYDDNNLQIQNQIIKSEKIEIQIQNERNTNSNQKSIDNNINIFESPFSKQMSNNKLLGTNTQQIHVSTFQQKNFQ